MSAAQLTTRSQGTQQASGADGRLGRYRRAFLTYWDARLSEAAEDLAWNWPTFLAATIAAAVGLVAGLHLLQMFGTGSGRGLATGLLALAPALALAVGLIGLLLWAYWRSHVDPTGLRPYVVAFLAFALTVGVCLEAFAGASALLWQHDAGGVTAPAEAPSLWAAEKLYAWHLVDSIPLLNAPETLGWSQPDVFTDKLSGALLFLFQLLVLAPIFHLAFSGYRAVEQASFANRERWEARARRRHASLHHFGSERTSAAWFSFGGIALMAILGSAILVFVSSSGSFLNRRFAELVPDNVTVAGVTPPLAWVEGALQLAAVLCLAWFLVLALQLMVYAEPGSSRSLSGVLAVVGSLLFFVALLTELIAAVTVLLIRVGLVNAAPDEEGVGAAVGYFAWNMIDAIPGLALSDTLNWPLRQDFADYWTGALLLVLKATLIVILAVPVARALRGYWHRARSRQASAPELTAAADFAGALSEASAAIDRYEQLVLESRRSGERAWMAEWSSHRRADRLLDELEDTLVRVTRLFGDGAVPEAANAAVTALERRLEHVRMLSGPAGPTRRSRDEMPAHDDGRAAVASGLATYVAAAARAMRAASPRRANPSVGQ